MRRLALLGVAALCIAAQPHAPTDAAGRVGYCEVDVLHRSRVGATAYSASEEASFFARYPHDIVLTEFNATGQPAYSDYKVKKLAAGIARLASWHTAGKAAALGETRYSLSMRADVYRRPTLCAGGTQDGEICFNSNDCKGGGTCSSFTDANADGAVPTSCIRTVRNAHFATYTEYFNNGFALGACEGGSAVGAACSDDLPCTGGGRCEIYGDKTLYELVDALSERTKPHIYGDVDAAMNRIRWDGYFVWDLTVPACRAWMIQDWLQKFAESNADVIDTGFKPGWWAYRSRTASPGAYATCWVDDVESWQGYAHRRTPRCSVDDPAIPTTYAAGEYEAAVNAFMLELFTALDSHGRCASGVNANELCDSDTDCASSTCSMFDRVKVHVSERPDMDDRRWSIFSTEVRLSRHMGCEVDRLVNPKICKNGVPTGCNGPGVPSACCTGTGRGSCCK